MLLACKNDIKEVNALAEREKRPDMTGENLELVYSDSARIKYRVLAPEYIKVNREKEKLKNLFNNSEEVRENTNNSIKYIRKHANTLHLTLSNNMKYEV